MLVKVTEWFTLFFIPLVPYMSRFALVCPNCKNYTEVPKDELREVFKDLHPMSPSDETELFPPTDIQGGRPAWPFGDDEGRSPGIGMQRSRYEGKNETQIAYLSKLEARERELEAQRESDEAEDFNETPPPAADVSMSESIKESADVSADVSDAVSGGVAAYTSDDATETPDSEEADDDETAPSLDARERVLQAKELALEARAKALRARERALSSREAACLLREKALNERELTD